MNGAQTDTSQARNRGAPDATHPARATDPVHLRTEVGQPVGTRRPIKWVAYLYILPAFAIVGAFHIFPVFYAIYVSLHQGAINKLTYVGLKNYITALTGPTFWHSLVTTFAYALLTMPFAIILGLIFASLLFQPVRGRSVLRTIFFLPYVVSTVGSSIVWASIFDPTSGLANYILAHLGIPSLRWLIEPLGIGTIVAQHLHVTFPSWAQGPAVALVAVSIYTVWQSMGYDVVIFLAGLTNVPRELYDAARIDGANGWELFRFITIPMLAPTTFFVVVISVIGSLQAFNQIFAMNTAAAQQLGGPIETTNTLTVYMFNELYTFANYGYASAVAILLSLIILVLTLINFRFLGPRAQY